MWDDRGQRPARRSRLVIEAAFPLLGALLAMAGAVNEDDEEAIQTYVLAVLAWIAWSLALLERRRPASALAPRIGIGLATAVVLAVLLEDGTIADEYTQPGTIRVAVLGAVLLAGGWLARRGG
jgi:hypothetical protein